MHRISYTRNHPLGRFRPNTEFTDEYVYSGVVSGVNSLECWIEGTADDDYISVEYVLRNDTHKTGKKRVMELGLSRQNGAFHVDMARIDTKFQGFGIAPKLYRFVIRKLGIVLQAGSSQSPGGRSVWARMAKMSGIKLVAKDGHNKFYDVEYDDDELYIENESLYDGRKKLKIFAMVDA